MLGVLLAMSLGCVACSARRDASSRAHLFALTQRWSAEVEPARPADGTLRMLTYNVLANPASETATRIPVLLQVLEAADADIIALQEVTPWFLEELSRAPWARRYHVTRYAGVIDAPDGVFLMSRFPITKVRSHRLASRQKRSVVIAEIDVGGELLAVATVHMESPLAAGRHRAAQLDAIFRHLRAYERAVLMGDLNFGDGEEPETTHLSSSYTDPWQVLHAGDPGFTWDIECSPMARRGSYANERSRRLDRILVRTPGYTPHRVRILGDRPIGQTEVFPSDHFGLSATLVRGSRQAQRTATRAAMRADHVSRASADD